MILTELKIHHVRNIENAHFTLNPRFNFISGANGSGKTSVLEALYLLSCGHSFRCREISPIIMHQKSALTVFARSMDQETISIKKAPTELTQIKLNNQFCSTTSQLAYALPCQIIYADIFQIIDAGSSVRRSVLDWGLFHVKHNYLSVWKDYKRILKQRNALLKKRAPYDQFIPWDKQLNVLAEQLHELRLSYFNEWQTVFYQVLQQLTDSGCTIDYFKGWDKKQAGKELFQILADNFQSDCTKQYTQHGAHQADIIIESNDIKARQFLSRGQQKIILIALKLAQGQLLAGNCLYLFDDLLAELDNDHLQRLLNYLAANKGQYVITSVNKCDVPYAVLSTETAYHSLEKGLVCE